MVCCIIIELKGDLQHNSSQEHMHVFMSTEETNTGFSVLPNSKKLILNGYFSDPRNGYL